MSLFACFSVYLEYKHKATRINWVTDTTAELIYNAVIDDRNCNDGWLEDDINKYDSILERSKTKHKEIMKKMRYLAKLNKNGFDQMIFRFHDEVFAEIDCTQCGLCCRNMGPIFRNTDLKHICAYIGTNEKAFKKQYLMQDPDGVGFMLKELPCPFQNEDNTCSVYEMRTLSCKNFPHTKEPNIHRRLGGLALDSLFCPAAYLICEKIIEAYK